MKGFSYSIRNKKYHTLNYHLRNIYGTKVFKVSLNAGFTCPNLDGKISRGGCIFCSEKGSGDFAGNPDENILDQFNKIKNIMEKKWKNSKYIAYFQAFTNTYAPVSVLKEKYESILNEDGVVGIAISTRPDCLSDEVLDYLSFLNKKTHLWIELGLQSSNDNTLKYINRGHNYEIFLNSVEKLRNKNIETVVHVINGLPGETYSMMMETIRNISHLDIQGIKIHLLHVLKGTYLEKLYYKDKFKLMSFDEYINLVCDQIEIIPENIVIHRLTGDGKKENLVGPLWSLKKWEVLNAIDSELKKRNSWQGKKYKK